MSLQLSSLVVRYTAQIILNIISKIILNSESKSDVSSLYYTLIVNLSRIVFLIAPGAEPLTASKTFPGTKKESAAKSEE